MVSAPGPGHPKTAKEAGKSLYRAGIDVVLAGIAIIVPLVITIYVLQMVLTFIVNALQPFIGLLEAAGLIEAFERVELVAVLIDLGIYSPVIGVLGEIVAVLLLFGLIVLVGSVARNRYGERLISSLDLAITSIPGIGAVYKSFRRMGDVMLDGSAENFQEVKLVECLSDDMYVIGFETGVSPTSVEDATGHEEMVTMFIPLAPNPITGGFLTHVPQSRIIDVDMTIDEGIRAILTSGIASGEPPGETTELTMDDLEAVADFERLQEALGHGESESSEAGSSDAGASDAGSSKAERE